MLNRIQNKLRKGKDVLLNRKLYALRKKYSAYTMLSVENYILNLKLVSRFTNVPGCVVECGVWRGGVSAGMAEILGPERSYYLFDSFEGLPDAKEIDGEGALAWQNDVSSPYYFDNCKAEKDWAEKAMQLSGSSNNHLVKGWFNETIPGYQFESPIAVLRLDGDWYESTMTCLENLYPLVVKGGLIVIDDYYAWDGCSRAVHEYLARCQSTDRIHEAYSSGCYLVKS